MPILTVYHNPNFLAYRFKHTPTYHLTQCDWSAGVCSSDLR